MRRHRKVLDCHSTRPGHRPPVTDGQGAGLTEAFMSEFDALLASGDRAGALQLLDRQMRHTYALLDAVTEFEQSLDDD